MDDIMRDASADTGGQPVAERSRAILDADSHRQDLAQDAGASAESSAQSAGPTARELAALLRSRGVNDMTSLVVHEGDAEEPKKPEATAQDVAETAPVEIEAEVVEATEAEFATEAGVATEEVAVEPEVMVEVAQAEAFAPAVEVPVDEVAVEQVAAEEVAAEEVPAEEQAADAVTAEEVAAAVAAEEDTLEIDEESAGEAEDGLPPVPELADADAVGRMVFVLLLSQRDGLTMFRLAQACNVTQKVVEASLVPLQQWLQQMQLPVEVVRTGESVKLLSLPEAFPFLQRLRGVKKAEKLSPAALETLAVIAYRQPVMRGEIEAIRGVKAGPMLRTLLQHKLVRVTGRADVPGRPLQYGTTDQFLERFGLASLQELPSVKEWKQLG
jgi:segregation and condensation protein B